MGDLLGSWKICDICGSVRKINNSISSWIPSIFQPLEANIYPRPSALKVQDSHKIKKPPLPPPQRPVIIYAISPKIIHTKKSKFMVVVQRLTRLSSCNFSAGDGQISPLSRLVATEKVSLGKRSNIINKKSFRNKKPFVSLVEKKEKELKIEEEDNKYWTHAISFFFCLARGSKGISGYKMK
ncbi:uncharacterized protein LOC126668735 [Mercurialis annua]|uniref:uncharacterized protein LOC126668735 n=1 Tax=Mercurialis annua TaxID=3986 RepID=UPI00215F9E76|nr:uncharacterized protein LOC126668735 [Mercurialis annua]